MTTLESEGLTVDDLDAMPDDGLRRELLDGLLLVSPAPRARHQRAAFELAVALRACCPSGLEVMMAPFDVRVSVSTNLQPDVLVARRSDLTEANLPVAPVLAVEVLSRSTRLLDLGSKKAAYEEMGCGSYWVVDPGLDGPPSLTAWSLHDGGYQQVGHAVGAAELTLQQPFEVTVIAAALVR